MEERQDVVIPVIIDPVIIDWTFPLFSLKIKSAYEGG
jgi:hypothetical protein